MQIQSQQKPSTKSPLQTWPHLAVDQICSNRHQPSYTRSLIHISMSQVKWSITFFKEWANPLFINIVLEYQPFANFKVEKSETKSEHIIESFWSIFKKKHSCLFHEWDNFLRVISVILILDQPSASMNFKGIIRKEPCHLHLLVCVVRYAINSDFTECQESAYWLKIMLTFPYRDTHVALILSLPVTDPEAIGTCAPVSPIAFIFIKFWAKIYLIQVNDKWPKYNPIPLTWSGIKYWL